MELEEEKVKVVIRYEGREYTVRVGADEELPTEDDIREVLTEKFPEAGTATYTQEDDGSWNVVRVAGQKG